MLPSRRVAIERNVDQLHSQLQARVNSFAQDRLVRLLVEEENKLGSDIEKQNIICLKIKQSHIAISRQRTIVNSMQARGINSKEAEILLNNMVLAQRLIAKLLTKAMG